MNWVRHGGSTTWFQTSRYCHAKVEFNSINWVRHGSCTTFETGLTYLINFYRNILFLCCLKVKWFHLWVHVPIISCKYILQNVNVPQQIETTLIKYSASSDVNAVSAIVNWCFSGKYLKSPTRNRYYYFRFDDCLLFMWYVSSYNSVN